MLCCGYFLNFAGVVKKVTSGGCFKIVHEIYRAKGATASSRNRTPVELHPIAKEYPELKPFLEKPQEILTPMRAHELLQMLTEDDLTLLWMNEVMVMVMDVLSTHYYLLILDLYYFL